MRKYENINATLAYLFNKAMIENPSKMENMPDNAVAVMQISGYDAFNKWAKDVSLHHPLEDGQQVVYVVFTLDPQLAPKETTSKRIVQARVEDLRLQPA